MVNNKHLRQWAILFVAPFILVFVVFWLVPLLYGVWISFHDWNISNGNNGFIGLGNYINILTPGTVYNNLFIQGLFNTLLFVCISVPSLIFISLGLALVIDNLPAKIKPIYRTIFFLSYSVSVTAVTAIFLWLFNGNGGYINTFLDKPINWLGQQPYAWLTILIATIWWTIGFNMLLFVNALDEVDESLYEAAGLDGAGPLNTFRYVTFPEIKNVTIFILITTVLASFNLYGQTKLMTNGGPEQSTNTLIMNTQQAIFNLNQLGIGSAMAILMGVIMMFVTVAQYWLAYKKKDYKEVMAK